jgi:hypothetical protein
MDCVRKDMDVANRQEQFEGIAAFADGERVDTPALREALADEAGRDYLIDLVAMREILAGTTGTSGTTGTTGTRQDRRRALTGLAAVLAMAIGLAGYAIGQQRSQVVPVAVLPPLEADVIVALEAPPPPTQVIRLGSGVPGNGGR